MLSTMEIPPKPAAPATATSDIAQSTQTSQQLQAQIEPNEARLHELVATDAECGMQTYGRLAVSFRNGKGARLWDHAGKEYLDFLAGIAVVTAGHCHPVVTEAIANQAATLMHTANLYYIEPQVELAKKLHEFSGGMRTFFCNSGAEANEAAIKLARKHSSAKDPNRTQIITTHDSFHGRTYAALAATGQPKYHEGFAPMPGGFSYVTLNDIDELETAINEHTAAVILEPIQGESGIRVADCKYLQAARELCDAHGALLVFDEVQCGIGRTGTFFGFESAAQEAGIDASEIAPDIITLAKGLGNGQPIGAMMASQTVAQSFVPGNHGSTFGGNFLSCAAALATLQVLADEDLMNNASRVGDYFKDRLEQWGGENGLISEVRGRGLMIGAQLTKPIARDLMLASLERGLIFNAVGTDILRFLPPLIISTDDVDEAMQKLDDALKSLS